MRFVLAAAGAALFASAPAGAATHTFSFAVPESFIAQLATQAGIASFDLPQPTEVAVGDTIDVTFNFEAPLTSPHGLIAGAIRLAGGNDGSTQRFGTASYEYLSPQGAGPFSRSNFGWSTFGGEIGPLVQVGNNFGPPATVQGVRTVFTVDGPASGPITYTTAYYGAWVAVPEASTWAMMIAGFGAVGCAMRRASSRRRSGSLQAA
jgi:hypothetical protein